MSPRRNELLTRFGFPFSKMESGVSEETPEMKPAAKVRLLAESKALAVAKRVKRGLVLGFDTVVYYDGEVLEKPRSLKEAFIMLKDLSGNTHTVYSGIAMVVVPEGRVIAKVATTKVTFRPLSNREIKSYIESGEPMDKAGAYGIQGAGGAFVEKVNGCFFNVVGLPVKHLMELLDNYIIK